MVKAAKINWSVADFTSFRGLEVGLTNKEICGVTGAR
ncbi:MAG: hypothetical protein FD167_6031 [bacterium]|nr:MAG: hypothetical protein FD167_6031 [bacterium]